MMNSPRKRKMRPQRRPGCDACRRARTVSSALVSKQTDLETALNAAQCAIGQLTARRDRAQTAPLGTPLSDVRSIRVVLPGPRTVRLPVRPGDPLGSVVDLLRRCRLLMGVRSIRTAAGKTLTARTDWRETGVGQLSELLVDPIRPPAVHVGVFMPSRGGYVAGLSVPVADWETGADWESLLAEVRRRTRLPPDGTSSLAQQCGRLYLRGCHRRRGLCSFDEKKRRLLFNDEDDGEEVPRGGGGGGGGGRGENNTTGVGGTCVDAISVLAPGSGIAAAPTNLPHVQLLLDTAVWRPGPGAEPAPAELDLLFSPRTLLLLELLLASPSGRLLLHLRAGAFCDTATGEVFPNVDAATGPEKAGWTRVRLAVLAGDRLPRYRIPAGALVWAFARQGTEPAVEADGCVSRRDLSPADLSSSRWTSCPSELAEAVTRAMRL